MDINSLERFTEAQEHTYAMALAQVKEGEKRSHWMWFIFPQLRGLGKSAMAHAYGLRDADEARAYLAHPILSLRLFAICEALLSQEKRDPDAIFGHTDALKLCSSMTLFAQVSEQDSVFHRVLSQFYDGQMDGATLALLRK